MRKTLFKSAIAIVALGIAAPALATTYSLSGDWSDGSNPNGVWSYGPGLSYFAQPVTPNALNVAASSGYWGAGSDFFAAPFMLRATVDGTAASGYGNSDFLAGDVLVHGPNDGSSVEIDWTAPAAGMISVTSSVWYAHTPVSRSQDIVAFLNSTSLGAATVTNGIARSNALTLFNGAGLNVAAGDILSFRFSKGAGQQFGSLTGISALVDFTPSEVAAVPEPATWAMMLLGFFAIGSAMRRRDKADRALSFI